METGFQNLHLDVRTVDGLDDVLLNSLHYIDSNGKHWRAPAGSSTDGLSVPKIIRVLPGYDATGDDWLSGVLHDACYRGDIELECLGRWHRVWLSRKYCDWIIRDAMKSQGVGLVRRNVIYYALRLFGWIAFNKDRRTYEP